MSVATTPDPTLRVRLATADNDAMSIEAIVATDNPVEVHDYARRETVDEVLRIDGVELPDQVPLIENHDRSSLDMVVGAVRSLAPENGTRIVGRLFFSRDDERATRAWNKVRQGHINAVSVGYRILQQTTIPTGQSATIRGRVYTATNRPLRVVTSWTLKEVSLVPIGADPNAKTRDGYSYRPALTTRDSRQNESATTTSTSTATTSAVNNPKPRTTTPRTVETQHLARTPQEASTIRSIVDGLLLRAGIRQAGGDPCCLPAVDAIRQAAIAGGYDGARDLSDDDLFRVAGALQPVQELISQTFTAAVLIGYTEAPDTTEGWTYTADLTSFRDTRAIELEESLQLTALPRYGTATVQNIMAGGQLWKLMRYAASMIVDEQTIIDDQLGVFLYSLNQVGRAARRLRPDLVYSVLHQNPTLRDDIELFHADHNNLNDAGGDMGDEALSAGLTAIANQTHRPDSDNHTHVTARGKYLVVTPNLEHGARKQLRAINLSTEDDITLRVDSRMGEKPTTDPRDGTQRTGSTAQWMLAADANIMPSIIVGYRGGKMDPAIRVTSLQRGTFGYHVDVLLDVAVTAIDHRGLYLSRSSS